MNKPVQLTEQDLHFLVENAVQAYLTENGIIDEDVVGGMKNLVRKGGQAVGRRFTNMGQNIANKMQDAKKAVGNQMQKVGTAVTDMYDKAKLAYDQGSAQQDIQNVNKALQPMVQKGILGQKQYRTILGMLNKAMQAQGGQSMM